MAGQNNDNNNAVTTSFGVRDVHGDSIGSQGGKSTLNPTYMRANSDNGSNKEKRRSSIKTTPGKLISNYCFRSSHDLSTWYTCMDMKSSR